jgi:DNA modification methylase
MSVDIRVGDCLDVLRTLDAGSVQTCITSPPYFGLRDYGVAGQIGLEPTPDAFVAKLVAVFAEVRRVLADDGTLWLNLGDSYATAGTRQGNSGHGFDEYDRRSACDGYRPLTAGLKSKDLIGIPWRVAFALQADGWYLRSDIIWHKPNPMPESVTDRPTKAHEYLFLLSKNERYYYDASSIMEGLSPSSIDRLSQAVDEQAGSARANGGTRSDRPMKAVARKRGLPPRHQRYTESSDQSGLDVVGRGMGRNKRSVWTVATAPFKGAHFATFPPALIEPCILAGSRPGDTVLDPFGGAGTSGLVADRLSRNALLIELNPAYAKLARERITNDAPLFAEGA